jgi:hypothetical protein
MVVLYLIRVEVAFQSIEINFLVSIAQRKLAQRLP